MFKRSSSEPPEKKSSPGGGKFSSSGKPSLGGSLFCPEILHPAISLHWEGHHLRGKSLHSAGDRSRILRRMLRRSSFLTNRELVAKDTLNRNLRVRPRSVYVAVFFMANVKYYHWGLLVATNERSGVLYHNTNRGGRPYFFEAYYHPHLLSSSSLLTLVETSQLVITNDKEVHDLFAQIMKSVPIGDLQCRGWLWKALYKVAERGLIQFDIRQSDALQLLETECLMHVSGRKQGNARIFKSKYYKDDI
ncbi:hypothetical protein AJ79_04753 [Helicocarpus griseus UAMH5409]|uniref:Uncharacterized protein n=1 Tax=Helicocarpus griseus UAMH5409 TaxID=1447875 RepID=A0A2B7XS70_9EURO|nr:hypothetical protein AJ79_04753 [Helicocarpus griseus UAMH5409]